jgi:hypothetical protein
MFGVCDCDNDIISNSRRLSVCIHVKEVKILYHLLLFMEVNIEWYQPIAFKDRPTIYSCNVKNILYRSFLNLELPSHINFHHASQYMNTMRHIHSL